MTNFHSLYLPLILLNEMHPILRLMFIVLFFIGMFLVVFSRFWIFAEQQYAERYFKPFFFYPIVFKYHLKRTKVRVLETKFSFYQKLSSSQKRRFRHRVAKISNSLEFHSRASLAISDEMKTLISATAAMMTFGFRDYGLPNLEQVVLYPKAFESTLGENLHKGEYSPAFKTLALSWKDFVKGYDISNDNLNLGIHELSHVIHIKCYFGSDISSLIYNNRFNALKAYLRDNEAIRQQLIQTDYFRAYAFTNEVEFIAVLIECFFETPKEFKSGFPEVYIFVKQMLNYNYSW